MKKIFIYLSLILLSAAWSCSEKDNMEPVGNWEITAPGLVMPNANTNVSLDENEPDAATRFEWTASTTTNRFLVQYTLVLVPTGSTDYDHPILSATPANAGKDTWVALTAEQIDYALWAACYPANAEVKLQWVVVAKAIEKKAVETREITFKRFETEYVPTTLFLTGEATEGGADLTKALPFRALTDADKNPTGVFEIYTHLTKGSTYFFRDQADAHSRKMGGADGKVTCGSDIAAPETGEYRITVDLVNNTYNVLLIDRWSLVGDAVEGGWGGDVPLAYVGKGVWEKEVPFLSESGFVFRANGDWGLLMKRIKNTATANNKGGKVILESEGNDTGVAFEDIPGTTGLHKVTLSLTPAGYTYTLTKIVVVVETIIGKATDITANAVSGTFTVETTNTPSELYLLEDGKMILKFTKDGDIFKSVKYVPLQASKNYEINTAEDGSGDVVDGDEDGIITVDHDQAYTVNVDFDQKELSWKHYNLKLFHWNNDGGWDQRQELVMAYSHPFTFTTTGDLTAGFDSKINSPWDIEFGSSSTSLTGTMVVKGPNYKGITSTGTYKATIVVADDFASGEYTFVKQ
ncbi:hypothetical protein [Chryseolinea lacunae]|uniref:SusE outer membrane protein domain-containing protein n=1 Tax=Chryseolinea lacunae TaxID=2801331 RepID=A0ABS1KNG0_9BACT|nr:hypothetical protein [Chryseolinea lacunae]MBL0740792.1 hypothetical protein [Chryseolinea lacunae]